MGSKELGMCRQCWISWCMMWADCVRGVGVDWKVFCVQGSKGQVDDGN